MKEPRSKERSVDINSEEEKTGFDYPGN